MGIGSGGILGNENGNDNGHNLDKMSNAVGMGIGNSHHDIFGLQDLRGLEIEEAATQYSINFQKTLCCQTK